MKKNIIMIIITLVCSVSLLLVLYIFNTKDVYYVSDKIIDNNEITMQIKNGSTYTDIIKLSDLDNAKYYRISSETACSPGSASFYYSNSTKRLKIKVTSGPLKCKIVFEEIRGDINIISFYVDNTAVNELDANKKYNFIRSECNYIDGTVNNSAVKWDIASSTFSISNLTKETSCKIYLENLTNTLYNKILLDNTVVSDENINFRQQAIASGTNGLYYVADSDLSERGEDKKRIYYFRGIVDNNWVLFGGYKWRIVRTTSEGGVKLIYSGSGTTTTSALLGPVVYNSSNTSKYYVGYTYNASLNSYAGTQTNSSLKNAIDTWYSGSGSNYLNNYQSYLSTTAIFCNDRSEEIYRATDDRMVYPANRRYSSAIPTFICSSDNKSRYTVSSSTGNGYLTYPIATITVDELMSAGLIYGSTGTGSLNGYIQANASGDWHTITPIFQSPASMCYFEKSSLNWRGGAFLATTSLYYRPVVALKSCVTVTGTGTGTFSNPYTLSNTSC